MIGVRRGEVAKRFHRCVLLAVFPLLFGEQDHCALCGVGVGVSGDYGFKRFEVFSLVQGCAGGFLSAFFDAAIDHEHRGGDDENDDESDELLLIAVEKLFKGAGAVGDFSERGG